MKRVFTVILILYAISAECQQTENRLDTLIVQTRKRMSEKQIQHYFILAKTNYSAGTIISDGKKDESYVANYFDAYIFWEENTKCFLRYVNRNFYSAPMDVKECDFLKLDPKTIDLMSSEKVLPYEIVDHGRKSFIDQPIHFDIKFYFANNISNQFPEFYVDNNSKSLNKKSNDKMEIVKLYKTCKKLIEQNIDNIKLRQ
jgi:hypothetical protein